MKRSMLVAMILSFGLTAVTPLAFGEDCDRRGQRRGGYYGARDDYRRDAYYGQRGAYNGQRAAYNGQRVAYRDRAYYNDRNYYGERGGREWPDTGPEVSPSVAAIWSQTSASARSASVKGRPSSGREGSPSALKSVTSEAA